MQKNTAEFIVGLLNGEFDQDLEEILSLVRSRMDRAIPSCPPAKIPLDRKQKESFTPLRVGQRIWLNSKVRPKYMIGAAAVITKVNRTRVKLRLDNPNGRFGQSDIACPMSLISTTEVV
jgi:hypothetical protein